MHGRLRHQRHLRFRRTMAESVKANGMGKGLGHSDTAPKWDLRAPHDANGRTQPKPILRSRCLADHRCEGSHNPVARPQGGFERLSHNTELDNHCAFSQRR